MISLILPSFKRAELLDIGLWSISRQTINYDLEILVLNDGIVDDTEKICKKYPNLNIRYIFSGQRNLDGAIKSRVPAYAINIGVKQCKGDIILLSCPEMLHLNNSFDLIIEPLLHDTDIMTTMKRIAFEDIGDLTVSLIRDKTLIITEEQFQKLTEGRKCVDAARMPYFMGMHKSHFIEIGGYDEDFIGYAGDDNDIMDRLRTKGLTYKYTAAKVIHLFHGGTNINPIMHKDNPAWVYNWNLFNERKGIINRNIGKNWGKL